VSHLHFDIQVFVNDEGLIKSEFTHDGVHLNERGYKAWVDFVKPILYTFKK
jgi:lysophospholipase L1-like esterase